MSKTSKILLIVGHNSKSKGAHNKELNISEYDFWLDYVNEQLASWIYADHEFRVIERDYTKGGYRSQMRHVHKIGEEWGADLSVEFHFNSVSGPTSAGHEVLYYHKSLRGEVLAGFLEDQLNFNLPTNGRGAKGIKKKQNGGYGLYVGPYPSILVEPFFNRNLKYFIEGGEHRESMNNAFFDFFRDIVL